MTSLGSTSDHAEERSARPLEGLYGRWAPEADGHPASICTSLRRDELPQDFVLSGEGGSLEP